jgi:hypothetical protein
LVNQSKVENKMAKGKKTGGRVKGVLNKLTTGAKEVIAQVAANIGGVARMTKWVRESSENEKAFWTNIYTKLLALQVAGDKDNPLSIHRIERTIVEHHAPAASPDAPDAPDYRERTNDETASTNASMSGRQTAGTGLPDAAGADRKSHTRAPVARIMHIGSFFRRPPCPSYTPANARLCAAFC